MDKGAQIKQGIIKCINLLSDIPKTKHFKQQQERTQ